MMLATCSRVLLDWLRSRATGALLIELTALFVVTTAVAAAAIPVWLVLAYRPERVQPVNRLLEACQEASRRGSLAIVGVAAGCVLVVLGGLAVGNVLYRCVRDLRVMRRFLSTLASSRDSLITAGGMDRAVSILPDRVAFTAGLFRPRIYLGSGLIAALRPREIEAVILHESHHRIRYDPLRCWLVELALALPMFPPGRALAAYYRASREAAADRAAVAWQGDDRPLLMALTRADALQAVAGAVGLSADREHALREIRHCNAKVAPFDLLAVALTLFAVLALLAVAVAGLSDWQRYWFCPAAAVIGR